MRRSLPAALCVILAAVALVPGVSYAGPLDSPGGVSSRPSREGPTEPTPTIDRNPGNPNPPPAWKAVPRGEDRTPLVAPAKDSDLGCPDLGSLSRAREYLRARPGAWRRIDTDRDGKPCEGWTWGNYDKPLCVTQALRDDILSRMWVWHGAFVLCWMDGEYGYVTGPPGHPRARGTNNSPWQFIVMDGDWPPPRGNPILDTTLRHEMGHLVAYTSVSDAERAWIVANVPGLDTENGWAGVPPGDTLQGLYGYYHSPAEAWAESWVRCQTPQPWRPAYAQIPCFVVRRAITNTLVG